MSVITDLKGYADAAVETGRTSVNDGLAQTRTAVNDGITSFRTALDDGFDGANQRATALAETASGLGVHALNRLRYNAYAAVGAGDAAITTAITRVQEFPGEVTETVARVQNSATDLAERVQARFATAAGKAGDAVTTAQASAENTVEGVRSGSFVETARTSVEGYVATVTKSARVQRDELYNRGEAVVAEFRKDPRIVRVTTLLTNAAETVTDVAALPARRRAAQQGAATRARKASATKASAGKSATTRARKAPAKKAATRSTTPRARKTTAAKKTTA